MTEQDIALIVNKLEYLTSTVEALKQQLEKPSTSTETGTIKDAARLLQISPVTVRSRLKGWIEGAHYWRQGNKLIFDLLLLEDWQRNQGDPIAHQRAIAARQSQLLSNKGKRKK